MNTNINLGYRFLRDAAAINGQLNKALKPLGLTTPQLRILQIVAFSGEGYCTVSDIKMQMVDPMSNVSRMLNKMSAKKLIEKKTVLDDLRSSHICITNEGMAQLKAGKNIMDAEMQRFLVLSEADCKAFDKILKKLV